MRQGETIQLCFNVTQTASNIIVLEVLEQYFGCGHIRVNNSSNNTLWFRVRDFHDICNIVIPFFNIHPQVGRKHQDFLDFCRVAELMKVKAHQTPNGLAQIKSIKEGMNRGRA